MTGFEIAQGLSDGPFQPQDVRVSGFCMAGSWDTDQALIAICIEQNPRLHETLRAIGDIVAPPTDIIGE